MPNTATKKSQQSVNYRRGSPVRCCGMCVNYWHRDTKKVFGGCTEVTGNITPYGVCDLFYNIRNPFGPVLDAQEQQQLENWFWEFAKTKAKPDVK
jgi:hypothetical protein